MAKKRWEHRGVVVRCANPVCVLTGRSREFDHPPVHTGRFLGTFCPGTRGHVRCYCCGHVNQVRVAVGADGHSPLLTIRDIGSVSECPLTFEEDG